MPSPVATIHDKTVCLLGEGVLWHPLRQQLIWFDILNGKLYCGMEAGLQVHSFDEPVSAAGWIDRDRLLIAATSGLSVYDLEGRSRRPLQAFPEHSVMTRSNDGRTDPWGGFWISTIGLNGEPGAGAIYRYFQGRLTPLFTELTVPNAICFAPDRRFACYADTVTQRIMRVALDADGWPIGPSQVHIDMTSEALNPDGAVIDQSGCLWVAQWGAGRVSCYGPDGNYRSHFQIPATNATCVAFGGPDGQTLFVTSAAVGLETPGPRDGLTYRITTDSLGQSENRVVLTGIACG